MNTSPAASTGLKQFWHNTLTSLKNTYTQTTQSDQYYFVNTYSLLGAVASILIGTVHSFQSNSTLGKIEIIIGFIFIINIVGLYLTKNLKLSKFFLLMTIHVLLIEMLITGGIAQTGIYWYFMFPPVVFFLMGKIKGLLWIISIYWFTILIYLLSQLNYLTITYELSEIRQLLVSLFVVSLTVYIYQSIREESNKGILLSQTNSLQKLYHGLEDDIKVSTEQLAQRYQTVSEEKVTYQAILHSLIDGMIITDLKGNIIIINTVAHQLLGIPPTVHPIGQSIFQITTCYKEDGSEMLGEEHPLYISLMSGQKWTANVAINSNNGKKKVINFTTTVIHLNNKRIGGIAILRDITKEKEIDRMKTEFISLASHQLRTPLSAIKWFTEMLLNGDAGQLTGDQMEFAKNISDSTERMIDLVNALLNISRIESGRIMIDPKPTNLKELVDAIITELRVRTNQKQQQLIVSVHGDLPTINVDPRMIRQVYLNLLTNAIKYSPKGSEITVFISRKGEDIISQISDNGYGIPKDQQDKVFQKFFRAENVAKVETDGTGLGLYLIKAIVESSKGKIWFQSEEGKGTTFWFSLPLSGTPPKKGEVTLDM